MSDAIAILNYAIAEVSLYAKALAVMNRRDRSAFEAFMHIAKVVESRSFYMDLSHKKAGEIEAQADTIQRNFQKQYTKGKAKP